MIQVNDVLAELMNFNDMQGYSQQQLTPCCEKGLAWVQRRLRDGADKNDPLITTTAAALAHYFFFIYRLSDPDKYSTYKAGDMTISRDISKELEFEKSVKNEAIAAACSILSDGGFCFCAT